MRAQAAEMDMDVPKITPVANGSEFGSKYFFITGDTYVTAINEGIGESAPWAIKHDCRRIAYLAGGSIREGQPGNRFFPEFKVEEREDDGWLYSPIGFSVFMIEFSDTAALAHVFESNRYT